MPPPSQTGPSPAERALIEFLNWWFNIGAGPLDLSKYVFPVGDTLPNQRDSNPLPTDPFEEFQKGSINTQRDFMGESEWLIDDAIDDGEERLLDEYLNPSGPLIKDLLDGLFLRDQKKKPPTKCKCTKLNSKKGYRVDITDEHGKIIASFDEYYSPDFDRTWYQDPAMGQYGVQIEYTPEGGCKCTTKLGRDKKDCDEKAEAFFSDPDKFQDCLEEDIELMKKSLSEACLKLQNINRAILTEPYVSEENTQLAEIFDCISDTDMLEHLKKIVCKKKDRGNPATTDGSEGIIEIDPDQIKNDILKDWINGPIRQTTNPFPDEVSQQEYFSYVLLHELAHLCSVKSGAENREFDAWMLSLYLFGAYWWNMPNQVDVYDIFCKEWAKNGQETLGLSYFRSKLFTYNLKNGEVWAEPPGTEPFMRLRPLGPCERSKKDYDAEGYK